MKKIPLILLFVLSLAVFNSCGDDPNGTNDINYVNFESPTFDFGVDLDGTTQKTIKIYATQITGATRTYNVTVDTDNTSADPNSYVVPSTITIPANSNVGELIVEISDINIGEEGKTLTLKIQQQSDLLIGGDIAINISQVCPFNEVILNILFDGYGSETSWELIDSSDDTVIASVESGTYQDGQESATQKFCLPDGDYEFVAYDAYGDGLSYPANGKISLINNGNVLVEIIGDYGSLTSQSFNVTK